MTRPWRLTRQAETSLIGIARWTFDNFGPRQADIYENELLARCEAIADGTAFRQSCSVFFPGNADTELWFARAGGHFIIYVEDAEAVTIIDFLHSRSHLPQKVADLAATQERRS